MPNQRLVGTLLIAVGVLLLVLLQTGVGGEAIPMVIGLGFLIAYAATRLYGLLIPGGILTGLGAGIVATTAGAPDTSVVLGLGLGFLAIAPVDRLVRGRATGQWWPFIPGGILTVVGLAITPGTRTVAGYLVPVALVVAGLWLIVGRRGSAAAPTRDEDRRAPSE